MATDSTREHQKYEEAGNDAFAPTPSFFESAYPGAPQHAPGVTDDQFGQAPRSPSPCAASCPLLFRRSPYFKTKGGRTHVRFELEVVM